MKIFFLRDAINDKSFAEEEEKAAYRIYGLISYINFVNTRTVN